MSETSGLPKHEAESDEEFLAELESADTNDVEDIKREYPPEPDQNGEFVNRISGRINGRDVDFTQTMPQDGPGDFQNDLIVDGRLIPLNHSRGHLLFRHLHEVSVEKERRGF